MPQRTKQRILQQAVALIGADEVALRLKVTPAQLDRWLSGEVSVPDHKLVRLAAILDNWSREVKSR